MATLQLRRSFHSRQVGAFVREAQHQFLAQGGMRHFTAAEPDGDLHFVARLQELARGTELKTNIMIADADTELDFFGFYHFLIFTGFFFTFGLFESEFAVVHDTAHRRNRLRGDFNKVKITGCGNRLRVARGHDAKLRTVNVDDADFAVPDILINLMLYVADAKTPPIDNKKMRHLCAAQKPALT